MLSSPVKGSIRRISGASIFTFILIQAQCVVPAYLLPAHSANIDVTHGSSERLPETVTPESYNLTFRPDLQADTFKGSEDVRISISEPTGEIVLNSVDLKISDPALQIVGGSRNELKPLTISYDHRHESVHLVSDKVIPSGRYLLSLKYSGKLNKHLRGFYGATAKDTSGKPVKLALTQLEPTDARRMFPCFDEPAFKTTFKIRTVINRNLTAISNAAIESNTISATTRTITFHKTPKMSTYLVALFIGPFRSTPPVTSCGVQIRVWNVGHKVDLGTTAANFARQFLAFYSRYFAVPYPGDKLDLIAIPDFEAGAMENLGAISFRETALLFDPKRDSFGSQVGMASVLAHEMAHMWFGDLVTMKWWDDIWLNEAFATWMAHMAIDDLRPEWRTWDEWAEGKNESMETDGLASSRAIHANVANPAEAFEMFDDISYSKGASIIRMLEKYIGADSFQHGVQRYIKTFQFGNASTDDLWRSIEAASGKPIPQIMHEWVYQPGFPVLTVQAQEYVPKAIEQDRFFNIKSPKLDDDKSSPWMVPVGCMSDLSSSIPKSSLRYLLIRSKTEELARDTLLEPYFCNAGGVGYYRVAYPQSNLIKLAELKDQKLSPIERYTLLSDQSALTFQGALEADQFLSFLLSFRSENDPFVIIAVCGELHQLFNLLDGSSEPVFAKYVQDVLRPIKRRLTWQARKGEPAITRFARSAVLTTLANFGGDSETVAEACRYFARYRADFNSVSPDLINPIETIVAYNGNQSDYRNFWFLSQHAPTISAQKRALMALALFRAPELVGQTLNLTIGDKVKLQDSPNLLSSTLQQKDNNAQAWQFVIAHWKEIASKYPPFMIGRVVDGETIVRTQPEANQFHVFFDSHKVPEAERDVARTWERIQNNISFLSRAQPSIHDWLEKHYSKNAHSPQGED
jgi:puromycin-sensitive aminopeptidase